MDETQIELDSIDGGEVITEVYIGSMNFSTPHTRFVHIEFGAVKTAEVVDDAHHKLQGVMCF